MSGKLPDRFRQALLRLGITGAEDDVGERGPVVVAVSGGRDSTVLLQLLRFESGIAPTDLVAAHFDHGMREGSAEDAQWVESLAARWGVRYRGAVAETTPNDEAAARAARYRFLHEVARAEGDAPILTGHHADDQAETVLFRVLRGTGIDGLVGIRERRADGVVRPLLHFRGAELQEWAEAAGLDWRVDETNAHTGYVRNAIRHRILPEVEESVSPHARQALVALGRAAVEERAAWRAALRPLVESTVVARRADEITLDRAALLGTTAQLRARVLRAALRPLGVRMGRGATRALARFVAEAESGRRIDLPGGVVATREFEQVVVRVEAAARETPDQPVLIREPGRGSGTAQVGGRVAHVTWWTGSDPSDDPGTPASQVEAFDLESLRFPLELRSRRPGDRLRSAAGTRALKKLFGEARIGVTARAGYAVLADAAGTVLWVPGLARAQEASPRDPGSALSVHIAYE